MVTICIKAIILLVRTNDTLFLFVYNIDITFNFSLIFLHLIQKIIVVNKYSRKVICQSSL